MIEAKIGEYVAMIGLMLFGGWIGYVIGGEVVAFIVQGIIAIPFLYLSTEQAHRR